MYIEQVTRGDHKGPAWISYVRLSKSGQTVYFSGRALKKYERGMYSDVQTGERYWITGVKKRGTNRHWAGSGKILVSADAVEELKSTKNAEHLQESQYEVVEQPETTDAEIKRFMELENEQAG